MRIDTIHARNYGSFYGDHTFRIADRGLCLVLGDNQDEPKMSSNGGGKSTIFEAMDWCLFGKVPRDDHVDSIINEEAGGDCQVDTHIIDDAGKRIIVRRFRGIQGKSGAQLWHDGVELAALDVKETQCMIDELLGLDRDVFHAAVLFAQFDLLRFADAKDSERMGILTKILQLEQIDDWLGRAKEAEREVGTRRAQLDREMNQLTGRIGMAENQIPGLEQQARGIEDGRAVKLREATVQLNKHMEYQEGYEKIANQEEHVRQVLDMAEEMGGLNGELNLLEWDGPDGKVTRVAKEEQELRSQVAVVTSQGREVSARITKFENMSVGDCSECGQPITGEHVALEVGKLTSDRKHMRESFTQLDRQLQVKAQAREAAEHEREVYRKMHMDADRAATAKMEEARRQLHRVKEAQKSLKQNRYYIESLRETMEETRTKENPYYTQLEEVHSLVDRAKEQMVAYGAEIETELETQAYYTFWTEAFGPRGLKSYILDERLHEMTEAANHWVRILTGGTIWIRFETQTMGRSTKKLSNKINVRVFRYNPTGSISERNYRSWSGGEKQRVSLGIDFGLTRLIANRASKRYDVLILDELFKHLDRAGREAVIEMLHHLRQEKSSVICIDHDQEFQGAFENRVLMTKKNQRTTIQELDDAETQSTGETPGDVVRAVPSVSQAVG